MSRFRRALLVVGGNLIVLAVLLAIAEGVASLGLTAARLYRPSDPLRQLHVAHDDLLGWVNRPNVFIPDLYGPGVFFRTNAQGFRNLNTTTRTKRAGSARIICSGDSFAMGYGVDDDHTWCRLLESTAPDVETVNLGQSGYGVDQAYLRYRRDGVVLEQDVHLFTFIRTDFNRMKYDRFQDAHKPVLSLVDGELVPVKVPVPQLSAAWQWLYPRLRVLRSLALIRAFAGPTARMQARAPVLTAEDQSRIVAALLADLRAMSERGGSTLVLVFLPTKGDYARDTAARWRRVVRQQALNLGVPFVDLIPAVRSLPRRQAQQLFLRPPNGHYSNAGNAFVASHLQRALRALPGVGEKLAYPVPEADSPAAVDIRSLHTSALAMPLSPATAYSK